MTAAPSGPAPRHGAAARTNAGAARKPRAPKPPTPAPTATGSAALGEAVAAAWRTATIPDDVATALRTYRPTKLTPDQWRQVRDLVILAVLADAPADLWSFDRVRVALTVHARRQLRWGTSRTITAWYSEEAVERTLANPDEHVTARSLSTIASRLRKAAAAVTGRRRVTLTGGHHYVGVVPYTSDELGRALDWAEHHPRPTARTNLLAMLWLCVGAGLTNAELAAVTSDDISVEPDAVMVNVPGANARRVPVHRSCEAPLADLLAELPPGRLITTSGRNAGPRVVWQAQPTDDIPALTTTRLRATWLALVLEGQPPLQAVLRAAGVDGERSYAYLVRGLPPLDEGSYRRAIRGSADPVPDPAQLALFTVTHPQPAVGYRPERGAR